MNRFYLEIHGYPVRSSFRKNLVKRSGNYFEKLTSSPVDNQYTLVESVPESRRFAVDQTPVQDFQINEFGWPSSDISMLLKAQSEELTNSILSRLVDLKAKTHIPPGISDKDIIKYHIPSRYLGTSSELLTHLESKIGQQISSEDVQDVDVNSVNHIDFASSEEDPQTV